MIAAAAISVSEALAAELMLGTNGTLVATVISEASAAATPLISAVAAEVILAILSRTEDGSGEKSCDEVILQRVDVLCSKKRSDP